MSSTTNMKQAATNPSRSVSRASPAVNGRSRFQCWRIVDCTYTEVLRERSKRLCERPAESGIRRPETGCGHRRVIDVGLQQAAQTQILRIHLIDNYGTTVQPGGLRAHIPDVQNETGANLSLRREIPVLLVHRKICVVPPHRCTLAYVQTCIDHRWMRIVLRIALIPYERRAKACVRSEELRGRGISG